MTRILLDPAELAGTASELRGAAGEYQAIGARVASCDCGCMPAGVAATVDAATASIRSRLDGLAYGLAAEGGGLDWRAGVPQNGGLATAVSSASGGPAITDGDQTLLIGGGFDTSYLGGGGGGMSLTIGGTGGFEYVGGGGGGGGGMSLVIGGTGGFDNVGGSDPLRDFFGGSNTLVIGGTGGFDYGGGGGYNLIIGGTGGFDYGGESDPLGDFFGGGNTITIGPSAPDPLSELYGMAWRNNDPVSMAMISNIIAMQQRATGIWTLPDGWRYAYSSSPFTIF